MVFEPRVHLVPDNDGAGHFNVLRGHLEPGAGGQRHQGGRRLRAQLRRRAAQRAGLLTLYDPEHGRPAVDHGRDPDHRVPDRRDDRGGRKHLARPDSRVLGHVGARGTAFWNVTMLDELFDLDEIRVTSRRPESREAFAEQLAASPGTPVRVTDTAEEAFDGADILVEASRLTEPAPLLRTGAVRPGAFVVPYGTVSAVELDLLDVMDKVVVDDWREAQSGRFGALRAPRGHRAAGARTLHAELGEVVTGRRPGREHADERILLWHRGLVHARRRGRPLILHRAEQAEVGTMLRYR